MKNLFLGQGATVACLPGMLGLPSGQPIRDLVLQAQLGGKQLLSDGHALDARTLVCCPVDGVTIRDVAVFSAVQKLVHGAPAGWLDYSVARGCVRTAGFA